MTFYNSKAGPGNLVIQILLVVLVTTSCRLSRSDVIGKWQVSKTDTLYIHADNSFILIDATADLTPSNGNDTKKPNVDGTWKIYKTTLAFTFNDSTQRFSGNCKSYQYMWLKGTKRALVRPVTCNSPTNQFVAMTKIE